MYMLVIPIFPIFKIRRIFDLLVHVTIVLGDLCDNIGLVGVSAKWSYVTASPSHHDQAIPILSPLLFMHVNHPYIPLFKIRKLFLQELHYLLQCLLYFVVVCSLKSMCVPSFIVIGYCVSELHGHICRYCNVLPEAIYCCFTRTTLFTKLFTCLYDQSLRLLSHHQALLLYTLWFLR